MTRLRALIKEKIANMAKRKRYLWLTKTGKNPGNIKEEVSTFSALMTMNKVKARLMKVSNLLDNTSVYGEIGYC
jgi:hypothetical protein